MTYSIDGRTAIVTGSAHGVGLAIARHFVARGANVMFADLDEDTLAAEIGNTEGTARYFAGDLRERLCVANLLSATVDAFDRIDILVNASRQITLSDPLNPDADGVEPLLQQNLLTSLRLSQGVAKRMIAQAERDGRDEGTIGAIVNISATAATRTQPELMGYAIAMAALDQMTRAFAVAMAPKRIRVNAVAFGSVMSASLKAALRETPDWRETIIAATPLGRIAPPSDLVEAVQFLASEGAGFITGQVLTVDGGRGLVDAAAAPAF